VGFLGVWEGQQRLICILLYTTVRLLFLALVILVT